VLPTTLGPQLVEAGPVLVVAVDAEQPEPELGADRLDGGEVVLGARSHAEPEVAQLADDLDVAALPQRPQPADGPVAIALEVADQTDDHGADPASGET